MTTACFVTAGQVQWIHGDVLDMGGGRGQRARLSLRELPPQEASLVFVRGVKFALLHFSCLLFLPLLCLRRVLVVLASDWRKIMA